MVQRHGEQRREQRRVPGNLQAELDRLLLSVLAATRRSRSANASGKTPPRRPRGFGLAL
jgi:hypothetical protein